MILQAKLHWTLFVAFNPEATINENVRFEGYKDSKLTS